MRGLAYALQEKRFGGLKRSQLRKLMPQSETTPTGQSRSRTSSNGPSVDGSASNGSASGASSTRRASRTIKPGTRLVREWHGVTHTVLVLDDGVEWQGRRYRSLSLVAREITGARWSGPRFFGLAPGSPSTARSGGGVGGSSRHSEPSGRVS